MAEAREFATYQEAVDFLFAMVDYEKLSSFKYNLPNFDLHRTELLLESLGNPHHNLKMIHIAGTKGKGSTAIIARTLLTQCGYRVGLFTSPHLVDLEERAAIDGRMIAKEDVRRIMSKLRPYVDEVRLKEPHQSPTFFELVTALGFSYFAEQKVDFAVIEVGMGGRLDSTNVITPLLCVMSRIDYDHVKRLGPTLAHIAREKAGIIKRGIPVVCAGQPDEAMPVFEATCAEKSAPLHVLGREFGLEAVASRLIAEVPCCRFTLRTPKRTYEAVSMPLLGAHQAANAALAIRSVELLEDLAGVRFDETIAREALALVRCPGRIEIIPGRPLTILDGAHNVAAMKVLRQELEENFKGRRIIFVFSVAKDKDIAGILREALPLAHKMVLTKSDSPRAMEPVMLRDLVKQMSNVPVVAIDDAAAALEHARQWAEPDDVICITGSLYLAGKLRPLVRPEEYRAQAAAQQKKPS